MSFSPLKTPLKIVLPIFSLILLSSCPANSDQYHLLDLSTFIRSGGRWLTARELGAIYR